MSWNTPPDVSPGDSISATDKNLYDKGNLLYLFQRPMDFVIRNGSANYSATTSTWQVVDSTNLKITLTVNSGRVLCLAQFVVDTDASAIGEFSFNRDTAETLNSANTGLSRVASNQNDIHITQMGVFESLTVGSHDFYLYFRNQSATNSVKILNNADFSIQFFVIEI